VTNAERLQLLEESAVMPLEEMTDTHATDISFL
jgi:hypothetical protein